MFCCLKSFSIHIFNNRILYHTEISFNSFKFPFVTINTTSILIFPAYDFSLLSPSSISYPQHTFSNQSLIVVIIATSIHWAPIMCHVLLAILSIILPIMLQSRNYSEIQKRSDLGPYSFKWQKSEFKPGLTTVSFQHACSLTKFYRCFISNSQVWHCLSFSTTVTLFQTLITFDNFTSSPQELSPS